MKIAFFCVDALLPNDAGDDLELRSRCAEVAEPIAALRQWARDSRATFLATTCLRAAPQAKELQPPQGAWLSWDTPREQWEPWLHGAVNTVVLERRNLGSAAENVEAKAFDVFAHHPNAHEVIRAVGANRWIVFGAAIEHCIRATVEGLCQHGVVVEVITDASTGAAVSNENSRRLAYEQMKAAGAVMRSLHEVLPDMRSGGCSA